MHSRGFLSAVSGKLHFGLAPHHKINKLEVTWPDGKIQLIENISPNQLLSINYEAATAMKPQTTNQSQAKVLFAALKSDFAHIDPPYNDYQEQILLPHQLSQTGPAVAKADVNKDGWEDVYLGGGHTQAGQLLLGNSNGGFTKKEIPDFDRDKQKEDVGACFFDADNDGDADLYVVSGSYEFSLNSKLLVDRLYINDGEGNFTKTTNRIPEVAAAGSIVTSADFDGDGDIDLFVGGRVVPGQYPYPPNSYLLQNDGGTFIDFTQRLAPDVAQIGMVTDAVWKDMDQDADLDLILTGEWMGIVVFVNEGGQFSQSPLYQDLLATTGWWNKLIVADVDQDGDQDLIAGNLGLNYKFHAAFEN